MSKLDTNKHFQDSIKRLLPFRAVSIIHTYTKADTTKTTKKQLPFIEQYILRLQLDFVLLPNEKHHLENIYKPRIYLLFLLSLTEIP